jgi:crossover junction endodeoxyribonuclease RusA
MAGWSFITLGLPVSQGSKEGFVNKRTGGVILTDAAKGLKPWRQAVVAAAPPGPKLDGPVAVHVVFTLPKPKSAKKSRFAPAVRPDIDKLVRAVFDAATDAGLWADDGRVVSLHTLKVWPGHSVFALDTPGVVISAAEMEQDYSMAWMLDAQTSRTVGTYLAARQLASAN